MDRDGGGGMVKRSDGRSESDKQGEPGGGMGARLTLLGTQLVIYNGLPSRPLISEIHKVL